MRTLTSGQAIRPGTRVFYVIKNKTRPIVDRLLKLQPHGDERRRMRQLTRIAWTPTYLSIDPRGLWSYNKAQRVLDVINPEAATLGVYFAPLDVTDHSMPHRRVMLIAYCVDHHIAVLHATVCQDCIGN